MENNRQIHLISRPQGLPTVDNFTLHRGSVPELKEGEVLVRSLYLSVDPYMRGRIGGRPSSHPPFPLNSPANGDGAGRVVMSKHPDFQKGDHVCGYLEWADYSALSGSSLWKIDKGVPVATALSVLGMPAMTAYFGLLDIGLPKPGETVVISGAAGAVGMIVGQIAKIKGCRVVGIAGTDAKTRYLESKLGFDAAVNYKNSDWVSSLQNACKDGVDIYFDNVGGTITDEVMKQINRHARVVLCGQISSYNLVSPDTGPRNFRHLIVKSATARGFLITQDYPTRYPEGRQQLLEWWHDGKVKSCESIVKGLENIPLAFLGLFSGENLGKQLVEV
ncbi:MAG: NADP-dependent oxidoreductase [Verrucomicrobia bacterium]|nr:NADP-dependent oxidoreductase [Verrucomicrobiota bacterium]